MKKYYISIVCTLIAVTVFASTNKKTKNTEVRSPANTCSDVMDNRLLSHTDTWGYLFESYELNLNFHEAGCVKISELSSITDEMSVRELASRLNRDFTKKSAAKSRIADPVLMLVNLITNNREKNVKWLAERVNEIYEYSAQ